jgi:hypothetical protein
VQAENVAQQADDRFVFRTTERLPWFEGDGRGGGAAVLVVTFGGAVFPVKGDFTVFRPVRSGSGVTRSGGRGRT